MKTELNVNWIRAALIRAAKTFCQSIVAMAGVGTAALHEISWGYILSCSAVAAILSICTSVAGLPEVDKGADQ